MPQTPTSPRRTVAREREQRALDLRKGGASFRLISEKLDITEDGARKAVKRVLDRLGQQAAEDAEAWRQLQVERLESLLLSVFVQARHGDLHALDRVLKIIKQESELLALAAPERLEISGPGGRPVPISWADLVQSAEADTP